MENQQPTENQANKIIAGEIKYEFDISDKDYGFNYNDSPNNILAAFEISHRELVAIKANLKNNLDSWERQKKLTDAGKMIARPDKKQKALLTDRLHRVSNAEYMMKLLVESYMTDLLTAADTLQQEKELRVELKEIETTSVDKTEN